MKCFGQHRHRPHLSPASEIDDCICQSTLEKASLSKSTAKGRRGVLRTPSTRNRRHADVSPSMYVEAGGGIRVFIAHEVRVMRESLSILLNQEPDIDVIGVRQLDAVMDEKRPAVDIVVIDAAPDVGYVTERISDYKETWAGAKVIVVGVPDATSDVLEYIEAGASGYVLKTSPMAHLIDTIRAVYRGEASSSPEITAMLFDRIAFLKSQVRAIEDSDLSKLTQRELEVLHLVVDGMSNKEIAASLNLEIQTVKNYVHNILDKLRVRNRREAVVFAQKSVLLDMLS